MGSRNSLRRARDFQNLIDDLKERRILSLDMLNLRKNRLLSRIESQFSVLMVKIPKNLKEVTMGDLYDRGYLNPGETSFLESVSAMEDNHMFNNFQSTIREFDLLKPTPKFDDISAISLTNKEEDKRKKHPPRVKLNFSSVKKSPFKTLTRSRVLSVSSKKRKASMQSPFKFVQDNQADNQEKSNEKLKVILHELAEIRNKSLKKLALKKEAQLNEITHRFNNIRMRKPDLEKEFEDYRDGGDLEQFWNTL